jgi:hypothetical protein
MPAFAGMTEEGIPAFAGMTEEGIPAFAGMTEVRIRACAGMTVPEAAPASCSLLSAASSLNPAFPLLPVLREDG